MHDKNLKRTHWNTFERCGAQIFIIEVRRAHTPIFKAIIKQVLRFRFLSFGQKNGRKKAKEEDADDGGDEDEDGEKKTRMIYLWQF